MTAPRSLQARLAAALSIGLALVWLAASAAAYAVMRHEMGEVFDSAIQETAQRILPLAVMEIIDREPTDLQRVAPVRPHHELLTYVVRDEAGTIVLASHDADPAIFPASVPAGFSTTATHRIYAEAALKGSLTILLAEPIAVRRAAVNHAAEALALPIALLVPLSFAGVWLAVRAGMRPIRRLCAAIETRGAGDMTPLAAGPMPSEIEPIAAAVNHLLDRLRRTLEAERSFTANSAHELRTPIASALAQTQRLLAETRDSRTAERARTIEATLKTLARLAEKLMQLARAEGGRLLAEAPYDAGPIVRLVCADVARAPDAAGRLALALPDGAVSTRMDPDALSILVRNLVENALKHGDARETVSVRLDPDGRLAVVNGGAVVPADVLARLSRPFERGATGADGTGLGLAIVDAVARGAGTTLALRSPAPGRPDGFAAEVKLPA
ncbi:sensor histidine kinase [Oharaeibacter diazotrophicus]|uniref:histidine kinase n=2 Tax=Oharaeibacter diazotrophicus TaxID=1920512 RepID=A0A4R6RIP8_9HYPH|nr:HAMP domain-containing sensor histidine kinase [Oharaeibacter diazotrophicus]TDP86262.1 two-component system OmpR family sensor kinase [Oharaeibacter diazotrophicus]BBE71797.1 sensor protein QseC [Pleomorphomonas sp. SM30]GLS78562.1 two-component sensor histidine kinase [Oharaeibacter diazotrophicus]